MSIESPYTKWIAAVAGLISSFISSTELFLGDASEDYSPRLSFIVAVIWLVSVVLIIWREKKSKKNKNTGLWGGKSNKPGNKFRGFDLLPIVIPLFLTIVVWAYGLYLHETLDRTFIINGHIKYGEAERRELKNRPIEGVKVLVAYNGKTTDIHSGADGFFNIQLDIVREAKTIRATYTKPNLETATKQWTLEEGTYFDGSIYMKTEY